MGNTKKSNCRATANRRAPTAGIQHNYEQTTALWREIQVVHSRPTQATGGPHTKGKEETGVDRRLPEWRNMNVPLGTRQSLPVQVVAGCACVPEERIWAPEVFIVGEGVHLIVDDSVRLMAQLNHANIIAADLGLRTYGH